MTQLNAGRRLGRATETKVVRSVPWIVLTVGIVAAFVVPLVTLVVMAFRTALPGLPGEWTMEGFRAVFASSSMLGPLRNSIIFAVSTTVVGTAMAIAFVFISTRTSVRLRKLVTPMMLVVLATPALFFALSWSMLGTDRVGLINKVHTWTTGSDESIFTINSWFGLIAVMSIKVCSLSYFLMLGPSLAMTRSLEEAAEVSGSSRAGTIVRVYFPLLSPAIAGALIIGFVTGLQAFETPQIIGTQAGIQVLSTEIFRMINTFPANYAASASLALGLVVLLGILLFLQIKLLSSRSYTTVGGKSTRSAAWDFPRFGWVLTSGIVVFALLAFVLPTVQLVLSSFNTVFGRYDGFTMRNYRTLFDNPAAISAIRNTIELVVVGGFVTVLLGAVITYALRSRPNRWKRALEIPTWVPWAMPGLVGALAILGTVLAIPALHRFYGTTWTLAIALVTVSLPIAIRFVENAVLQVDRQLVDASRMGGASAGRSFVTILIPLIAPSFLSGWLVTGLAIAGNLEVPLLLGSADVTTVSGLAYTYYSGSFVPLAAAMFCVLLAMIVVFFGLAVLLRHLLGRAFTSRRETVFARREQMVSVPAAVPVPVTPERVPTLQ